MNYRYGGNDLGLLQFLEERVRKDPGSSFFAMLAYFYLDIDKVAEALSVAQRGVIAHPNYSTGHVVLAMAMMRAGLFPDAKKELLKATDLRPGSKIIERLTAELDKQEQADTIGRKLAEQFRKGSSGERDIMKTVEETLKASPLKSSDEDFLIPGLDAIVGESASELPAQLTKPSPETKLTKPSPRKRAKANNTERSQSKIARAIIDKVAREFEDREQAEEVDGTSGEDAPGESGPERSGFDLDKLARELESAGPIRLEREQSHIGEEDTGIELTPEIVTDTLAAIFEQQGQANAAIEAYNILLKKKPERADFYLRKIAELKSRTDASY